MRSRPFLSVVLSAAICTAAQAQQYPSKPVRLISPYPPGGIDAFARIMTPKIQEVLGQPMIIENRAGANGNIGAEHVARSAPDGYTLLFIVAGTIVLGPMLTKVQPFDTVKDFTPVINLFDPMHLLTVSTTLPINSVKELIEHAKKNPGKLTYASSGVASVFHMNAEQFKILAGGIDMLHVPYKGSAPMATEMLAQRVDVAVPALNNVKTMLPQGKFRVLAVLDPQPSPALPGVRPIAETVPGFKKVPTWTAIFGPAGLPGPVTDRVNGAFTQALKAPEVVKFMDDNGAQLRGGTPQELAATIRQDLETTAKLIKTVGIKPE
jgi:tripartite-type tricarboxylate transporter receptor subunit TctC